MFFTRHRRTVEKEPVPSSFRLPLPPPPLLSGRVEGRGLFGQNSGRAPSAMVSDCWGRIKAGFTPQPELCVSRPWMPFNVNAKKNTKKALSRLKWAFFYCLSSYIREGGLIPLSAPEEKTNWSFKFFVIQSCVALKCERYQGLCRNQKKEKKRKISSHTQKRFAADVSQSLQGHRVPRGALLLD